MKGPIHSDVRMITNRSAPAATLVPVLIYTEVEEAVAWLALRGA